MTHQLIPAKLVRARLLRKSPVNAYLKLNKSIWKRLPPSFTALPPIRSYGSFLHSLVRLGATRRQYFGTFFFRNRPELTLIRRLCDQREIGSTLKLAFLACSNGAELYSVLWTIRSARPDLHLIPHAVDISREILRLAQQGTYSLTAPELVDEQIFARMDGEDMQEIFDVDSERGEARIKPWIKEGTIWHLGDAASPQILNAMEPQDMVLANNFLCHMDPLRADRCLRNIARLVSPGGYLFISGIDLDIRTAVARDLGWKPVSDLMEAIHDGDPSLRNAWPWNYWGLEPFNKRRPDWHIRYASVFQVGEHPCRDIVAPERNGVPES